MPMKRRDFITLLGIAAASWPLAAQAQQPTMPVVGFLNSALAVKWSPFVAAFRQGLSETGYVEGQNVGIEFRWAEGHYDRLPGLAADLVRAGVAVIVATGGATSALAAKQTTTTIPIVFSTGGDPIKEGLVASINRPGGNITGVNLLTTGLEAKRLEILHAVVPNASIIGALINPNNANAEVQSAMVQDAGRTMGTPVKARIVASLNRPEENITGITWFGGDLAGKRVALLHDIVPNIATIGLLANPSDLDESSQRADAQSVAGRLNLKLVVMNASTEREIDVAFATFAEQKVGAVVITSDPFLLSRREQIVSLAARQAMPIVGSVREYVAAGGLMSYGNSLKEAYRHAGLYVGRILRGASRATFRSNGWANLSSSSISQPLRRSG